MDRHVPDECDQKGLVYQRSDGRLPSAIAKALHSQVELDSSANAAISACRVVLHGLEEARGALDAAPRTAGIRAAVGDGFAVHVPGLRAGKRREFKTAMPSSRRTTAFTEPVVSSRRDSDARRDGISSAICRDLKQIDPERNLLEPYVVAKIF